MKKIIIPFILFIAFFANCHSQNVFNKIFNANSTVSRANAVIQTSDGGYLMGGVVNNTDVMCAIKTNGIGDTLWSFIYDWGIGSPFDIITTLIETNDGNYIVGGMTAVISEMTSAAFLIKLSTNGDTIWSKKYGLPDRSERCYNVKQTPDGGFAFCGWRYDSTGASSDVYLVKTDSLGNEQWEHTYGGANYDFSYSLEFTGEGGYMILGATYSYGIGQYNMYLIKTDSIGNMLWQRTYGGSMKDDGTSIIKTNDGNYILAGYIEEVTAYDWNGYVVKIDTSGIVLWQKKYNRGNSFEIFNEAKQFPTGDLVLAGVTNNYSGTRVASIGWLMKLDQNGDSLYSKTYSYYNDDSTDHYFYAMDLTDDGGIVMAGMSINNFQNPTNNMWLVKTDCMGNDSIWDSVNCPLQVGVQELKPEKDNFIIYPNPSNGNMTLEYDINSKEPSSFTIFDISGRLLKEVTLNPENKTLIIDAMELNAGVYFYTIKVGNERVKTDKLVIVK